MNTPRKMTGAAERPTTSAATRKSRRLSKSKSKSKSKSPTYINNLPENFQVTYDILKKNVCRVCATYHKSGSSLLPLFEPYKGCTLSYRINHILPILEITKHELPQNACRKCADQIVAWFEMHQNIPLVTHTLKRQAQALTGETGLRINERLLLRDTIQSILASYSMCLESEIVCQLCDARTTSEEFVRHLETKHAAVRDREALEMFVQEHVTFEEALASDPEPDTSASAAVAHLEQHAEETLDGVRDESELTEHSNDDHRSLESIAGAGAALQQQETNQKRIPAVCPHCNRTCSNKYNMLVHMNTHTARQSAQFDCECGKSYTTRGNLVAHRRAAHERVFPHACEECGRGFPTRGARDVHARRHSGARPFVCGACGLSFRGPGALRQHARTHAPRSLACALCGKRFRRRAHLRYHVGTHRQHSRPLDAERGRGGEPFPESPAASDGGSERDGANSDSESAPLAAADPLAPLRRALRALRDHYLARHAPALAPPPPREEEEVSAPEGDPAAFDDLTVRNQRRDRFDPETRAALDAARARSAGRTHYTCAQCGRRLGSAHAFVHHLRIHSGARPHVCHVCGASFRAPQGLARHITQTHERRARRACHLCSNTFANEQNLTQHLRTHTGERPHVCAHCGRRFAQSGALHAHRRTHDARRPHACARCPAAFRLRAGLARHARTHARPLTRVSIPAGTPPA